MKKRYEKNFNLISEEEFESIRDMEIAVVGLGGLGGNITEMLARFGFRNLILVDYDVFDESNLNRQILSNESVIGQSKTDVALKRVHLINSEVHPKVYHEKMTYALGKEILENTEMVFDALDNISSRMELARVCDEFNIPMVHGAIDGWYGQVSIIVDHSHLVENLYSHQEEEFSSALGNPSFTPAIIAGIQVSEGVKYLTNKGLNLKNKVLFVDLLQHMYEIVDLG